MLIMRLALLSCAFYLGIALVVELALFAAMLWKNDVLIGFYWWGGPHGQGRLGLSRQVWLFALR